MKALIVNGLVHEIFSELVNGVPLDERLHPDLLAQLIEAPEGVEPGWIYADGSFTPPQGPDLSARRKEAYLALSHAYETYFSQSRGYTSGWRAKADQYAKLAEKVIKASSSTTAQTEAAAQLQALLDQLDAWDATLDDYYEAKSAEIMASESPEQVVWAFSRFDASDPNITLPWHLKPLVNIMRAEAD